MRFTFLVVIITLKKDKTLDLNKDNPRTSMSAAISRTGTTQSAATK